MSLHFARLDNPEQLEDFVNSCGPRPENVHVTLDGAAGFMAWAADERGPDRYGVTSLPWDPADATADTLTMLFELGRAIPIGFSAVEGCFWFLWRA